MNSVQGSLVVIFTASLRFREVLRKPGYCSLENEMFSINGQ